MGVHAKGPPGPPPPGAASSRIDVLLGLEAAARQATSTVELAHLVATDWRNIVDARQIFVLRRTGWGWKVVAASGQSSVETTSPLIMDMVRRLKSVTLPAAGSLILPMGDAAQPGTALAGYPFGQGVLAPLRLRGGTVFGAALLMRAEPWQEPDLPLIDRLADTYAHAWAALAGRAQLRPRPLQRFLMPAILLALLGIGIIPVPLSALAPAEVVPHDPAIVTAPLDGVVRSVEVEPNAAVQAGDVLVRFVDTPLRSRFEVARQNVSVAEARERKLVQAAFDDHNARRELAVATSELRLAEVERDAARDALDRSVIRAGQPGVVVFQSRKDLEGRPVATGERLMSIARPEDVEFAIELPVKDSILAREGASVRIYLDADPLRPLDARVTQASFHAAPVPGGGLAFRLRARLADGTAPPRIGFRGTAQVQGDRVPLGYLLLRRPLTALRQHVGL